MRQRHAADEDFMVHFKAFTSSSVLLSRPLVDILCVLLAFSLRSFWILIVSTSRLFFLMRYSRIL
jgi:hypothetical protein